MSAPHLAAADLNLKCDYEVESIGKTRGGVNQSKSIGSRRVETVFFIKTDNGDYLDKMSISVNGSGERTINFKHPSEFEDEYYAIAVNVGETSVSIRRLPIIETLEVKAKANLSISRQTGSVSGEWVFTWASEGIVFDSHKLSGSCSKYEQAF